MTSKYDGGLKVSSHPYIDLEIYLDIHVLNKWTIWMLMDFIHTITKQPNINIDLKGTCIICIGDDIKCDKKFELPLISKTNEMIAIAKNLFTLDPICNINLELNNFAHICLHLTKSNVSSTYLQIQIGIFFRYNIKIGPRG